MLAMVMEFFDSSLFGLIIKETRQILRDKHLLFLLIFPPTIQLLLLGAALDPALHNVRTGVVDYSHSATSRKFISGLASGGLFQIRDEQDEQHLAQQIKHAEVSVGVVIPPEFDRDLTFTHQANVQVIIDGVDAYTAGIAKSYLLQKIQHFEPFATQPEQAVTPVIDVLFNPGLKSSWYFVPGVLGAMLTLTSTLVASAVLLREKELGTLEQLLMTPYATWEILVAKVAPIFFLLMVDALAAVLLGMAVFGVPFRGNPLLFAIACALYVFVGIGIGMTLATICKTERQSHLVSFFINVPVMQLSGAVVPFETMPTALRALGLFDPLKYFTTIARSLLIKGAGFEALWPDLLALALSAVVLFWFSLHRFRRQLN